MAKENTLIYRAQSGDEGAFADLMRAYHPFVYTIVVGIVDNPHDTEEVVQDAFLNAYQGLSQLEDATKFKSWLAEIARRQNFTADTSTLLDDNGRLEDAETGNTRDPQCKCRDA